MSDAATAEPADARPWRQARWPRLVCASCARVHRWVDLAPGRIARCTRCDAVMARGHRTRASSLLGLTLGALLLLLIANGTDLVTLRLQGPEVATTVPGAIAITWREGEQLVAVLSALTAIVAPAVFILLRLYLLLPLAFGRMPPGVGPCLRALHFTGHWNTVSVMAVAALLALTRMADLARADAGPALAALCALGLVLAAIESSGLRHLWLPDAGTTTAEQSAAETAQEAAAEAAGRPLRWLGCESCGWVGRTDGTAAAAPAGSLRCARCDHPLDHDPVVGLQRTWALLIASALLLLPANLLPMMSTTSALRTDAHTLLGGIAELWAADLWGLATIVFVASIMVPLLKIVALAVLAWSVVHAPGWRVHERARLYRLVQAVGHWSMLDVYVVALLVGMVRFGNLAGAAPGGALLPFAGVVVLTMLATHSFDPRWIWQAAPAASTQEPPRETLQERLARA